jgi:hypothetical protein
MIEFPDPSLANEDGLLAVGGSLEPETLLATYSIKIIRLITLYECLLSAKSGHSTEWT